MTVIIYTYNMSYVWTCPDHVTSVLAECWGGGGNGGSISVGNEGGGGGGGGAYTRKTLPVIPGNLYDVHVGGVGGTNSWFNSSGTVLAVGGQNGFANSPIGGSGGQASACIGDVSYNGGNGGSGSAASGGAGGGESGDSIGDGVSGQNGILGGLGGSGASLEHDSGIGGNGRQGTEGNGSDGEWSIGYGGGGGGGGGFRVSSGTRFGGNGAAGKVKLTYNTGGSLMTQVQARNTRKVNGAAVTGDNYTGQNIVGGDGIAGSTKNNGGTIIRGGTIASSLWTSRGIAPTVNPTGPIVYLSDDTNVPKVAGEFTARNRTFKAVSAGSFAGMVAGSYIARRLSASLAGVANTTLRSGGSDYGTRRSILASTHFRTSYVSKITYERVALTIADLTDGTPHPEQTYAITYSNTDGSAVAGVKTAIIVQNSTATNPASQDTTTAASGDIAAAPTLAVPGQLIYKSAALLPKLDVYHAKTQG